MKNDTNADGLPPLNSDVITDSKHYIDNLFADTCKKLNVNPLIRGAGFTKRSGIGITEAVLLLLLWKWVNMSSIAMFSKKALGAFSRARKDDMYDLMKREEVNWHEFNFQTATFASYPASIPLCAIRYLILGFFRKLLKRQQRSPNRLVTDKATV